MLTLGWILLGAVLGVVLLVGSLVGFLAVLAWMHRPEHCDWPGAYSGGLVADDEAPR